MEYKENIVEQERELRLDPLCALLKESRPQPPRRSREAVRRTLDSIETPPLAWVGRFMRRSPVAFGAASLALVLLLSGTAYAVAGWLHRDDYKPGDYLDTPPEQRTEASAIPEIEQVVQRADPKTEGCEIVMLPEMPDAEMWNKRRVKNGQPEYSEADWGWLRQLRPEIQEVLYDGTTFAYTIRFHTDHGGVLSWEHHEEKWLEAYVDEERIADTGEELNGNYGSSGTLDETLDDSGITFHSEHSLEKPLPSGGRISITSEIGIYDVKVDNGLLGMLNYTFSFDVDGALKAAGADTRSTERRLSGSAVLTMDYDTMWNMPVSLDGVVLEETASFRSTGVYLSYRVKEAPEEWTTQMRRSLLDPTNEKGKFQGLSVSYTLGGDDTVYEPAFPEVVVQEDCTLAYTVILPLFPSDYEVLKQRGVTVRLALHAVNSFNEEPVDDTWKQTTFPENGWDITTSYQSLLSFPLELP